MEVLPPARSEPRRRLAPARGAELVAGCEVRWQAAGHGDPALVLVHGGGANSAWWDDVVPLLAPHRRVVTLDLSGHGDSGRRDRYSPAQWGDEILAVVDAAAGGRAVVVGHSTGGRAALAAAARRPEAIEALVLLDSGVPLQLRDDIPRPRRAPAFASEEDAVRAFRLLPAQEPPPDPAVVERIARRSVVERDGAWTWKADVAVYEGLLDTAPEDAIPDVTCPLVVVQCEHSDVTGLELARRFLDRLGRPAPVVVLPGAHHHVMLEDPQAVVDLLAWLPETRWRR
jgi:pimeloyl-ACP methyl ester carboxylesterase